MNNEGYINDTIKTSNESYLKSASTLIISFLLLKEYAPIETVFLNRDNKKTKVNKEKFLNESDLKITIVNSNFLKNIIRTVGFKVSGHFRLQPYGANKDKRRLIWINEFDKKGYHLKAKNLS